MVKLSKRTKQLGQSTVEFLVTFSVMLLTVVGVGWVFKVEWDRGKCAYLVFEKTHAAVINSHQFGLALVSQNNIQIENQPAAVSGVGLCNRASETVTLPKLETDSEP